MKKVLFGLLLDLLLVFSLSHNSYAETRGPIGDHGRGCRDEVMQMAPPPMRFHGMEIEKIPGADHLMWEHLMGLGLDEKQREAIKEIKSRVIKEAVRKRADEHIAGIELKDLLDKDPVDMKAVEAKLKQIETLKTEMHLSFITATEEVKSKLTPEQRKKFREMLEMKPDIGPHLLRGMMRGSGMRMMPPPPCGNKMDMQRDPERMPYQAK